MKKAYLLLCLFFLQVIQGVNPRFKFDIDHNLYYSGDAQRIYHLNDLTHKSIPINTSDKSDDFFNFIIKWCAGVYTILALDTVVHELGHASIIKLLGHKIHSISFASGYTTFCRSTNYNNYHKIYITAAGPLASFLFSSSLLYYYKQKKDNKWTSIFAMGGLIGLFSSAINLIPFDGTDGQKILEAWKAIKNKK